ncbi:sialidase family protein [Paraflavitalea devenefica]|uniref:sialidase family protein n=1 Tax=Paraflavitalea devenefica TaxID=2716334 RepID=UPI001FEC96C7|nr:sialidase family protein [Paraflavitalea devenefica]
MTQRQYQVPVLLKKKDNPVLRITIYNAGPKESFTEGFQLNLSGTTDLRDIKRIKLYYAGKDSSFTNLSNTGKMTLLDSKDRLGTVMWIGDDQELSIGLNVFWVSVELNDKADPLHKIFIRTEASMQRHQHPVKIPRTEVVPLRIGYALRQHNDDNVHTYRIPGLATAKDGSLLAVYDVRRESARDLQGHIDIGINRSTDGGNTWLPLQIVLDRGTWGGLPEKFNGVSDACILVDKNTGHIFIAGLWMHGVLNAQGKWIEGLNEDSTAWNHQWRDKGSQQGFEVKQTSQFLVVKSEDNGKTWSQPVNLTRMCKQEDWWLWAPAPGAGITLRDGTLVFPTQGREKGKAFSNITYSKDGGKTWTTSKPAVSISTTENMAVELSDGSIMLNMRSNKNKNDTGSTNGRAIAVTKDLGNTWIEHATSGGALPEPVCMASIIRHDYVEKGKKKSVLLFSNPDSKTVRHRMTVKVSYDDGKTWSATKKILLDEGKSRGYSCLTSIDNNTIGILYESSMADMVFQKISLKELL